MPTCSRLGVSSGGPTTSTSQARGAVICRALAGELFTRVAGERPPRRLLHEPDNLGPAFKEAFMPASWREALAMAYDRLAFCRSFANGWQREPPAPRRRGGQARENTGP